MSRESFLSSEVYARFCALADELAFLSHFHRPPLTPREFVDGLREVLGLTAPPYLELMWVAEEGAVWQAETAPTIPNPEYTSNTSVLRLAEALFTVRGPELEELARASRAAMDEVVEDVSFGYADTPAWKKRREGFYRMKPYNSGEGPK